MGKNKQLNISFKNTTRDVKLWVSIEELEEKSQTIKEILYKVLVEKREFKE
ncbi:conserved hypothetical protein [Clostridium neonatale]|uniref:hypothetical protein n=1 Tax=Clostridium neonatale TaxID=137838 RepID=UPI002063E78F|nr:hypothetical protein [Clostridium neonatale]CAI3673385.1 conserved hypothetical protein [Clostridium neonatale]DAV95503.1 MAG TPA: Protein of unknown function (DUF2675) [Caudoviricetes sp.]